MVAVKQVTCAGCGQPVGAKGSRPQMVTKVGIVHRDPNCAMLATQKLMRVSDDPE